MFSLPTELQALVCQFAGVEEQWKRRFTYDVLPLIDKGWRYAGTSLITLDQQHGDVVSEITVAMPCYVCYMRPDTMLDPFSLWDPDSMSEDLSEPCGLCGTRPNERDLVSYSEMGLSYMASTYADFILKMRRRRMPGYIKIMRKTLDEAIWAWMEKVEARRNFKE